MKTGKRLIELIRRAVPRSPQDRDNLDIYLSSVLTKADGELLFFPVDYVGFLRACLERKPATVRHIATKHQSADGLAAKKFSALVDAMKNIPTLEIQTVEKIGHIADGLRNHNETMQTEQWAGDVRAHFEMSSSFGAKGRVLSTIIRYMGSHTCLELGTAYGMSALFILEAMTRQNGDISLITVEGGETQYSVSSDLLKKHYGDKVSCVYGWTNQVLPQLVNSLPPIDFMFHDAGHSQLDYTRDFNAILPVLKPGAVVLVDDIRWSDPRFAEGDPQCYRGWLDIVSHPRVSRAVEIDDSMGLLLLAS